MGFNSDELSHEKAETRDSTQTRTGSSPTVMPSLYTHPQMSWMKQSWAGLLWTSKECDETRIICAALLGGTTPTMCYSCGSKMILSIKKSFLKYRRSLHFTLLYTVLFEKKHKDLQFFKTNFSTFGRGGLLCEACSSFGNQTPLWGIHLFIM